MHKLLEKNITVDNKSYKPKIRVRIGMNYPMKFLMEIGQNNVLFVKRPLTPLCRFLRWTDAFTLLPGFDYDIIHSFNAVPVLSRHPYIITFEDFLPRVPEDRYIGWLEKWLQKKLLSNQCIALIAISEYAYRQFQWQNRYFNGLKILEAKTQVIYPAISLRRTEPKMHSDGLKLIFVGRDFMRKGGPVLLRAHKQLRKYGLPVETTIISSLNWSKDDYVGPPSAGYVRRELRQLTQEDIIHYRNMPNAEVLRLVENADYFIFPTFHDTFGVAVLEALSCGTPVITTNTCAQPEMIIDRKCGYLLPFENEQNIGKWIWLYRNKESGYLNAYEETVQSLSDELVEKILMCWDNRENYEIMSAAAIDRVKTRFNKEAIRHKLEQLYELCKNYQQI